MGGPVGWGPHWKHELGLDGSRSHHLRDYQPAWQREVFEIHVVRNGPEEWYWSAIAIDRITRIKQRAPVLIGSGFARSRIGAQSLAYKAAENAPPKPRQEARQKKTPNT